MSVSLSGAWDTHVHTAPDSRPRWHTADELADLAAAADMAGLVLKNHERSTVGPATGAQENHPGLDIAGGIVLNRSQGGLDTAVVEQALASGARIIWLPTKDGRGDSGDLDALNAPALTEILERIAAADAVLATGHIAAEEVLPVARAARRAGVKRILINHPEIPFNVFEPDLQKALRDEGAYLERCYPRPESDTGFAGIARDLLDVGAESTILATDLGRTDLPPPLDGLREMLTMLAEHGVPESDLDRAVRQNPRLLFAPRGALS